MLHLKKVSLEDTCHFNASSCTSYGSIALGITFSSDLRELWLDDELQVGSVSVSLCEAEFPPSLRLEVTRWNVCLAVL